MLLREVVELLAHRFPLVLIEVSDQFTLDDLDELFGHVEGYIDKRVRFAMAVRVLNMNMPDVGTLKHAAAWVRENKDGMAAYCLGTSILLESAALRGALRFVNALIPPPSPQACFGTWEATETWALDRLEKASLRAAP